MSRVHRSTHSPKHLVAVDIGAEPTLQITLVGVASGVAAGRRAPLKGNAQMECWTMFTTLDQFDTCLTDEPLRFGDPLLFARLRREFEHVLNRSSSTDVARDSGA